MKRYLVIVVFIIVAVLVLRGKILKREEISLTEKMKINEAKNYYAVSGTVVVFTPTPTPKKKKDKSSPGKQEYTIMAGENVHHSPEFTKVIINPENVKVGQLQTMTAYVKDEDIEIQNVSAMIETDNDEVLINFKLIKGSKRDGVWEGSWMVRDTHNDVYTTLFSAQNRLGESGFARLSWTDPNCCYTTSTGSTDCTVSGNCTASSIDGADGGTLTVSGGTMTVGAGTTIVFQTLIVSTGYVNVNSTGVLMAGYLCAGNTDADSYCSSTFSYSASSSCSSGTRVNTCAAGDWDCCDSLNTVYPGNTTYYSSAHAACAGYDDFDYNCDSAVTREYTGGYVKCGLRSKDYNHYSNSSCLTDRYCYTCIPGVTIACGTAGNYICGGSATDARSTCDLKSSYYQKERSACGDTGTTCSLATQECCSTLPNITTTVKCR